MVYVIQRYEKGKWEHMRHPDGQPMWYTSKKAALQQLQSMFLPLSTARIVLIKN